MTTDSPEPTPDEIVQMMRRAGLDVGADDIDGLRRAYAEIEAAGRRVRRGRNRNDEPAGAFRVPTGE